MEEEGARVGESTVRNLVARLRTEIGADRCQVMVPQTHPPAAEAEVDFGEFTASIAGQVMKLYMFCMRLSHSGKAFHFAYANQTQESFLDGHVRAFEAFGGVPTGMIRYDNLKPAVIRIALGRERFEHPRFVALRSHYGYDSFFCAPGIEGAHEKGGVEGEIGRFRRRHLTPIPHVGSLAALNAALAAADARDDARRIGGRPRPSARRPPGSCRCCAPLPAEPFDVSLRVVVPGRCEGPDLCAPVLLLGAGPLRRPPRRGRGWAPPASPSTTARGSSPSMPGRCTSTARTWCWTTTWRC